MFLVQTEDQKQDSFIGTRSTKSIIFTYITMSVDCFYLILFGSIVY